MFFIRKEDRKMLEHKGGIMKTNKDRVVKLSIMVEVTHPVASVPALDRDRKVAFQE